MTRTPTTFAFGNLEEDGDSWLLFTRERMIPLDVALSDLTLEHKAVSVIGRMGIPSSAPGITKLIVDKIVSHDDISRHAYQLYQTDPSSSSLANWLRAERSLLGIQPA